MAQQRPANGSEGSALYAPDSLWAKAIDHSRAESRKAGKIPAQVSWIKAYDFITFILRPLSDHGSQ